MRKWHAFFKPIFKCSNAKPMQTRITFDTQVKTALAETNTMILLTLSHAGAMRRVVHPMRIQHVA